MLNARFRPYILPQADTLDTITQAVSMVSILLAQYVHATNHYSDGMSRAGKKLATLLFLGSNVVLTLVHLRFIGAPLFAKLRAAVCAAMNVARGEPAELQGDIVFSDNADETPVRLDSTLRAHAISECVLQSIELEMNPLGEWTDEEVMLTALHQWRSFASQPNRVDYVGTMAMSANDEIASPLAQKREKAKAMRLDRQRAHMKGSYIWDSEDNVISDVIMPKGIDKKLSEAKKQVESSRHKTKSGGTNKRYPSATMDAEPPTHVIVQV